MNYKKNYIEYIEYVKKQNRKRKDNVYYERHHILPKTLGGSDEENNLVLLTAREHYLAHYLLCKIYKEEKDSYFKMLKAFMYMTVGNDRKNYNSRLYENRKKEYIEICSENMMGKRIQPVNYKHSKETKEKLQIKRMGRTPSLGLQHSNETKEKISKTLRSKVWMWNYELNKGTRVSPEFVDEYIRLGYEPHKGKEKTEAERQKISEHSRGIKKSEEHKRKISKSLKGKPKSKEQIENHRKSLIGKKASEETKRKLSESHKGKIWMNKDGKTKMVPYNDIENYSEYGWKKGRK